MHLRLNSIRDWLRARVSDSVMGIALSAVLHLVVITFPGSIPLVNLPETQDSKQKKGTGLSRDEWNGSGPEGMSVLTSGGAVAGAERPLFWGNPVFTKDELGPGIVIEKGRVIKTHTKRPPNLRPPEFTPYIPPVIEELTIDPDHDVLKRVVAADYDKNELEREKGLFRQALAEDLQDCRLDRIPLEEALLKLRYFRLQDELLQKGKKPDFSYTEVRDRFRDKIAAIRREVNEVSPEDRGTALLIAWRKDKIYEERRGHSLFNSIWYDIYNCRSGSEELLMYFSRYHPELELGTVRGSVRKYDGTLMGHMDPAVKINGRWLVFKTVSLDTVLVEEYTIGELYPLEKILLDYLPDLEDDFCRFNSPLARNGEPLAGDFDLYTKSDHPLVVKEKVSTIILRRENAPYSGPYRMMGREDHLLHEMLVRYQPLNSERELLNESDPYGDLLFHLLLTAPDERQSLLDLYLRKRVTTYPARFKRPLRIAPYIPEYGDLLATIEQQKAGGKLELSPGNLVVLSHFAGHGEYLRLNRERMAELTRVVVPPAKLQLTGEIREFLFSAPKQGVSAIFAPFAEPRDLVAGLLDDLYDLSMPVDVERERRANDTSARAIAIAKAELLGHPREGDDLLEQRISLLEDVLSSKVVDSAGGEARSRHEIPASLTFAETLAQGGRQGLSPGFIKDMVELLGEGEAVHAFLNYLQPMIATGPPENRTVSPDRQRTAEMLGYFDRFLLLEKSRQQIVQAARQLYKRHPDPAIRVGAAQFLVRKGVLDPARAGEDYILYLARKPFDVRELRSLLETGLTVQLAREHLRSRIRMISLEGMEAWRPGRAGNDQVAPAQLQLDELMRGANILGDDIARKSIAGKLVDLLMAVFEADSAAAGRNVLHYANGLNALSALSRSDVEADEITFSRFIEFGAGDPAGFLFAKPMRNWLGEDRYQRLIAKAIKEEQSGFASALVDLVRLRDQLESSRMIEEAADLQGWLEGYGATLQNLSGRVAAITFLNGLTFLEGQGEEAQRLQTAILAELFKQVELQKDFAMIWGEEIAAVRDGALLNENMFRALEFGGYFTQKSGQPGGLDLNHAPTIRVEGEFLSPCGPMAKIVDARNAPQNALFTKTGIYFDSILDAENSPAAASLALRRERELRELLTSRPLDAKTRKELDDTEAFFQDLDKSGYCDIRRLYVLEKLLKRAVLPERVPDWILALARDSFSHEMEYLQRIRKSGGIEVIFKDYRTLARGSFRQRWGEHPFSIRNLYGTLVLVKMGLLRVTPSGEFEVIRERKVSGPFRSPANPP
ncbi:MAG: hypothetical protein KKG47_00415 [Proteobacteria bacterium]|nr:hypothetical protein [Pseudomonadota bacterium]MBU1737201.1 hypothetical protein [Pseudomonadota bacterium]